MPPEEILWFNRRGPDRPARLPGRKIIHPALAGRPLAVGGDPDQRGVVATCSYEARRYGIHSAMPMSQAVRLCPALIIVRPDMAKYRAVSRQVHDIFRRYTGVIEPLSLDEAYLDVTGSDRCR